MRTELVIGWMVRFDDIQGLFRDPTDEDKTVVDEYNVDYHFYLATGETDEADEKKLWWCARFEEADDDVHTWYIYHRLSGNFFYNASKLIQHIETVKNDIPLLYSILEKHKVNTKICKEDVLSVVSVITDFYHS
jgi:hypothetical protein